MEMTKEVVFGQLIHQTLVDICRMEEEVEEIGQMGEEAGRMEEVIGQTEEVIGRAEVEEETGKMEVVVQEVEGEEQELGEAIEMME